MDIKDEKGPEGDIQYENIHTSVQDVCELDPDTLLEDCNEDSSMSNQMNALKTPKSLKIKSSSEVKRWASVVKSSKKQEKPKETSISDDKIENKVKTPVIIDSVFNLLPKNFEAQKGFIVSQNTLYFCSPCNLVLDSVNSIANHLKTRKHEDSIILYLKDKLPFHLDSIMEYVSFFGFNLCCNLCHCTLVLSSYNPYETIVNIIAHNASNMHITQKSTCDNYSSDLTGISYLVTSDILDGSQQKMGSSTQNNDFKLEFPTKSVADNKSLKRELELNKPVKFSENQLVIKDKQTRLKDLLGSIPSGMTHIDCVVENDKGSITCLICNRVVPPSSQNLYSHLTGSNHKRNKDKSNMKFAQQNTKENEAPYSTEPKNFHDAYKSEIDQKIPAHLRSHNKTPKVQIMPSKEFDSNVKKFMKNNPFISKNKDFIVVNVDGRNSYCKLCRTLIPLTTDLSALESSLVKHVQNEKHMSKWFITVLTSVKNETRNVGSGRVSHSLFEEDIKQEYNVNDSEMDRNHNSLKEKENGLKDSNQICARPPQKSREEDVTPTKAVIPHRPEKKVRWVADETEQDEAVLNRRQKQISYGKNTAGYSRYCRVVPRGQRGARDPVTPPRHAKCSRRAWDGMVRVWRRQLHAWDPPQPPSLESFPWLAPLPPN